MTEAKTKHTRRIIIFIIVAVCAILFIILGVLRGEVGVVFTKAVNICMECIGLGK